MSTRDAKLESYVREAMQLAERAAKMGSRPFGAVLVDAAGEVVARDRNRVAELADPLAHAEVNLIRAQCRATDTLTLAGFGIYTNAEPCAMCFSAMVNVELAVLGYGAPREPGTFPDIGIEELSSRSGPQRIEVHAGVLRAEAEAQRDRLARLEQQDGS
ncbi:nucleoside deaminase [Kribbella sp. CA-293567]|uniref:nucleoside deaminase n=1 Tax=Kribbella sp. CA-293567 TaxID=3002436 RepID=UPI0022DE7996|nr:nucleoside deaminase [Kribbella sp. CA-293567]WBQ03893.1 nucleoside deaminase [Kribbella sp. CA-293567]